MTVGKMKHRLHLQARQEADDGYGGTIPGSGVWVTQDTVSAELRPMRGGESVLAARLTGTQPYVVRVRQSAVTLAIKHDWQLVDARTGDVYAVKSPVHDPDGKRAWLEFIAEQWVSS